MLFYLLLLRQYPKGFPVTANFDKGRAKVFDKTGFGFILHLMDYIFLRIEWVCQ